MPYMFEDLFIRENAENMGISVEFTAGEKSYEIFVLTCRIDYSCED